MLATDGEMSFVTLYYDTIEWGNRDGVTAGLNAGDGITFEAPNTPSGSLTVDTNIGLGIMGVYVYRVDQFEILRPFGEYILRYSTGTVNLSRRISVGSLYLCSLGFRPQNGLINIYLKMPTFQLQGCSLR